jgi:exosortase/archaeosortase family protein
MAGRLLAIVDSSVHVSQDVIGGRYALRMVKTCDAMEANLLFVAAVVAFPAPWPRKVAAAIAGVGALIAVNVVRICSLYFVGVHLPTAFEIVHLELWPLAMVAIAAGLFLICARWMTVRPAPVVALP